MEKRGAQLRKLLARREILVAPGAYDGLSARLVESITEGSIRISGRLSLAEVQDMAGQIICAMHLRAEQYDSFALSDRPVCGPNATPETQGATR